MTINVTLYTRPNGDKKDIIISHINKEDEDWFKAKNVVLSMEEVASFGQDGYTDTVVVYASCEFNGDNVEVLEMSKGRNCNDTLASLRVNLQTELERRGS